MQPGSALWHKLRFPHAPYAGRMLEDLDLRLLAWFQAVSEEGSLGRAARRLGVSQPAVSRAIATLERKVGVTLLVRDGRGSQLTPAGEVLAHRGGRLLADARLALDQTRASAVDLQRLRVATSGGAGGRAQEGILTAFARAEPAAELAVLASNSTAARVEAVLTGAADVAFVRVRHPPSEALELTLLSTEPLLLAAPEASELAASPSLPLAALHAQPLAFYRRSQNPWWYDEVLHLLRAHGAVPRIVHRALWAYEVTPLVASGRALALVSESVAPAVHLPGVAYRRLEPVEPTLSLGLVHRREARAPLVRRFVDVARDQTRPVRKM